LDWKGVCLAVVTEIWKHRRKHINKVFFRWRGSRWGWSFLSSTTKRL